LLVPVASGSESEPEAATAPCPQTADQPPPPCDRLPFACLSCRVNATAGCRLGAAVPAVPCEPLPDVNCTGDRGPLPRTLACRYCHQLPPELYTCDKRATCKSPQSITDQNRTFWSELIGRPTSIRAVILNRRLVSWVRNDHLGCTSWGLPMLRLASAVILLILWTVAPLVAVSQAQSSRRQISWRHQSGILAMLNHELGLDGFGLWEHPKPDGISDLFGH
uniref:TNFR-Cys domain-containing protein n=1 Tax=Macrostomum lignano TaxID=282301 RepID=A0A1I8I4T0_9PLAT